MARNNSIKILRATRAALDAQAVAVNLRQGEPYLITDENRFAIGTSTSAYQAFLKEGEGGGGSGIDVTTAMQILPDNIPVWAWSPNLYNPTGDGTGPISIHSGGTTDPVQLGIGTANTAKAALPFARFTSESNAYAMSGIRSADGLVKRGTTTFGGFFFEAVVSKNAFVNGHNGQIGVLNTGFEYSSFASQPNQIP